MEYCEEHKKLSCNGRWQEAWVLWHTQAHSVAGGHPADQITLQRFLLLIQGEQTLNSWKVRQADPDSRGSGQQPIWAGLLVTMGTIMIGCYLGIIGLKIYIYPCLVLSIKSGNYSQRWSICQLYNKNLTFQYSCSKYSFPKIACFPTPPCPCTSCGTV